ncbi:MAG: thiolase family protein [Thermaerobacter sp.]|nr:thiolase family protein [Thermaerobacter sp.]
MSHPDVVIIDGTRTAIGTFGGSLTDVAAKDLGAHVIREALTRSQVSPDLVDEVIMGCVGQAAENAFVARLAALGAGLPVHSTAQTVNRLCGSGLQAIITGAQWLKLGDADTVVAGGTENMSQIPYYVRNRWGKRLGHQELEDGVLTSVTDPFGHYPMGVTAERVCSRFEVGREEQDQLAYESQARAKRAIAAGVFQAEIVPVPIKQKRETVLFQVDEHPRDTSLETLAKLKPAFKESGSVTAGNSSGINDGAAAVVMTTAEHARQLGVSPRLRVVSYGVSGLEPEIMGYAPVRAIEKALDRAGLTIAQIGLVELNEAFAAQAVAVIRDAHLDWSRTNVNGGAIALGHPIGATGAILTVKLMHEMERRHEQYGMVTMCIGGGQGIAAIFENLQA